MKNLISGSRDNSVMRTFSVSLYWTVLCSSIIRYNGEDPRMALIPGIPVYSNFYGKKCDIILISFRKVTTV